MPLATTSDGIDVHFETVGHGPDVVLIHGLTDRSESWGSIASVLAHHYRVTTVDLRGHGQSADAGDYRSIGMARDVRAVVAAADVHTPLVVGHSLGGIVATAFASQHDVRGVVNVDQSLQLSTFKESLMAGASLLQDPVSFPAVIALLFESLNGPHLTPEMAAAIASTSTPRQEVVMGVWGQVLTSSVEELDHLVGALCATVTAPYLALMFGAEDSTYRATLNEWLPQSRCEFWQGVGHFGHRERPDEFVDRVIRFDQSLSA